MSIDGPNRFGFNVRKEHQDGHEKVLPPIYQEPVRQSPCQSTEKHYTSYKMLLENLKEPPKPAALSIHYWAFQDKEQDVSSLPDMESAGESEDIRRALVELSDDRVIFWGDHGRRFTDHDMEKFDSRRLRFLFVARRKNTIAAFCSTRIIDNFGTLIRGGGCYNKSLISLTDYYKIFVETIRTQFYNAEPHLARSPYLDKEAFVTFAFPFPRNLAPYGPHVLERKLKCYRTTMALLTAMSKDLSKEKITRPINSYELYCLSFNAAVNSGVFWGNQAMPPDGYPRIVVGWLPNRWGKTNLQQSTDLQAATLVLCVRDYIDQRWTNRLRFLTFGSAWPCPHGLYYILHLYGDVFSRKEELESVILHHLQAARSRMDEETTRPNTGIQNLEFHVCYDPNVKRSDVDILEAVMANYRTTRSPFDDVLHSMYVWERDIDKDLVFEENKEVQDAMTNRKKKSGGSKP